MTGGEWRWSPPRSQGIWRHGAVWAKPLVAAAPWITLALILAMFGLIGGRLAAAPGVVFDLPDPVGRQAAAPGLAALVLPSARADAAGRETLVFFDDARYSLTDDASLASLQNSLKERAGEDASGNLLLLADRRVPAGELMRLVGIAKQSGVRHVQIAEKRE